ncbi:MAG: hypoxanthine phosphoribosyltransferase [Verrucomicrobiota bacterium]
MQDIEEILLPEEVISRRIQELGAEIEAEESRDELTLLILLHGSVLFAADLMRALTTPVYLEALRVASYHGGTESSGTVTVETTDLSHLQDRPVLLVDDILDTGRTLKRVTTHLREEVGVSSVRSCVLLDKQAQRAVDYAADFVGFEIADQFVVGYGLDYQGRYRNLPFVGTLKPSAI